MRRSSQERLRQDVADVASMDGFTAVLRGPPLHSRRRSWKNFAASRSGGSSDLDDLPRSRRHPKAVALLQQVLKPLVQSEVATPLSAQITARLGIALLRREPLRPRRAVE